MTTTHSPSRGVKLCVLLPALAGSLLAYSAAQAQSTGSKTVEEVVVTSKKTTSYGGLLTMVEAPKSKSIITQDYIATQPTGQNIIADLNLTPGVSYTNDDPFGMSGSGGHLHIRGFDGARISLLLDGVPLNDTGNYAIYPGELLDPEIISSANVNVGSTDVDSPTASAVGGLININSLTPTDKFSGFIAPSVGSDSYRRIAGVVNTGVIGPFGTKAWVEASDQQYDKYKGFGTFKKYQINGKIYQPLGNNGDFVAIAGFYDSQRQPNIYGLNLQVTGSKAAGADAWNTDYLGTYYSAGLTPGVAGSDNSPSIANPGPFAGNLGGNFHGNQINPTDTWNIRGESSFTLLHNLHLTVDPAFQSVLADGGGQARTVSESDARLIGAATTYACPAGQKGVDLNHDGDCLDTVRVFLPSLTHTERITVNTSLIWDITPDQLIRFSYAYDHGHHRQIGGATFLNADGTPMSVFGSYAGGAPPVLAADGSLLRQRDRLSIAVLNQYSAEYVGHFFNERLRIDAGIRDPHFSRDLNQYCYTSIANGSSVLCDSVAPVLSNPKTPYLINPFHEHVSYTRALPNVGLSWRFNPSNMVYFSYAEEFSAPKTDDLYTVPSPAGGLNLDNVKPETTDNFELGYRYQTTRLSGSVAFWDSEFHNRILSTYDPTTNVSFDRNIGDVRLMGVDVQLGAKPIKNLTTTALFSYEHSRVQSNYVDTTGAIEPLAGKALVDTPEIQLGGRITYEIGALSIGFQGKYVGSRFVTDLNDLKVAGYTVFDADLRYRLDRVLKGSYVQLNLTNIFDAHYYGSINTDPTNNTDSHWYGGRPYADQGAPRTVVASFKAPF